MMQIRAILNIFYIKTKNESSLNMIYNIKPRLYYEYTF